MKRQYPCHLSASQCGHCDNPEIPHCSETIVQSIPREVLYLSDVQTMGPAARWLGFVTYPRARVSFRQGRSCRTPSSGMKEPSLGVLLIDACGVTESAAIGQEELALAADCGFRGVICMGAVCGLGILTKRHNILGLAAITQSVAKWGSDDDTPSRHAIHVEPGTLAFADPDGVVLVPPAARGKLEQLPSAMDVNAKLSALMAQRRQGA